MSQPPRSSPKKLPPGVDTKDFSFLFFSEFVKRPVCAGKITARVGRPTDLVFRLKEPYPEAVGIYIEHGWGKPTEFIPWDKVTRIEEDAIFVTRPEGGTFPPFVDQPGWILVQEHLIGRTILDMDGRTIEVVNDVHFIESKGWMLIVHVDVSINGFLRRWRLQRLSWVKDRLIPWKYVQPLSLEDAATTDAVSLSITRKQLQDLPPEDLADILERLSGREQQALFSALDSEKAAEAIAQAEPRAQRQVFAGLRRERAKTILSEMSVPQLADLFSVLPHQDAQNLMGLLPADVGERVKTIISERESAARTLMSTSYVAMQKEVKVGDAIKTLRTSNFEHDRISYVYVVGEEGVLLGVVDLRELILAPDQKTLGEVMTSPVVSAKEDDMRTDIAEIFAKYHYRMIPVVDSQNRLLGVIHYNDIMRGLLTYPKV